MKSLVLILTLLLLGSIQASAAITLQTFATSTFSRGTGKLFNDINATTNTIFGGVSGTCEADDKVVTSVCNSCKSGSTACNTSRVHDDLVFQVTFISDTAGIVLVTDNQNPQAAIDFTADVPTNQSIAANVPITVFIEWKDICEAVTGSSTCDGFTGSETAQIRIGVDANTSNTLDDGEYATDLQFTVTGLTSAATPLCDSDDTPASACNFIAYPGDKKVFIENVRANTSFPDVDDTTVEFVRVFYHETSESAFPGLLTSTFADLEVNGTTDGTDVDIVGLVQNEVTGLTNGVAYAFAIGVVDEAFNVGLVTDMSGINGGDPSTFDPTDSQFCFDPTEFSQSCHIATPSEVVGLFSEEFDCFITTAAYGSPFKQKVHTFRKFRNRFLNTNTFGRLIIATYYKYSPPMAQWIRNHPQSKTWIQFFLWPLWFFAFLCLNWPWLVVGLTSILCGLLLQDLIRRRIL